MGYREKKKSLSETGLKKSRDHPGYGDHRQISLAKTGNALTLLAVQSTIHSHRLIRDAWQEKKIPDEKERDGRKSKRDLYGDTPSHRLRKSQTKHFTRGTSRTSALPSGLKKVENLQPREHTSQGSSRIAQRLIVPGSTRSA